MTGTRVVFLGIILLAASVAVAQQPRLTIYNQNFAVVRVQVPLQLNQGQTRVRLADITDQLEPDSVILRDPSGQFPLRILEQNYRADPISSGRMLQLYEGKEIDFRVVQDGHTEVVRGKIIRSGYVPPAPPGEDQQPYGTNAAYPTPPTEPIVEVDGKIRFNLPGDPLFPALSPGTILKPVLTCVIASPKAGPVNAELSYITRGMNWNATYNVIQPGPDGLLNLVGWVTIHNRTGKDFDEARIKLMAGAVNNSQPPYGGVSAGVVGGVPGGQILDYLHSPLITQKTFDVYHLYALHRPVTLRNDETKQVEFIRASGVSADRYFLYDGLKINPNQYNEWNMENLRRDGDFGTESNHDVRVMRQIQNSTANHLGIPLPRGRVRFYRADADGNLEFLGESAIRHVPEGETLAVYTGNAFDLTGDRTRTNYTMDGFRRTLDEAFHIQLRNHRKEPVEIRVDEHLYRSDSWEISSHSSSFVKMDSHTIEFRVQVPPAGAKDIDYTVHYTW